MAFIRYCLNVVQGKSTKISRHSDKFRNYFCCLFSKINTIYKIRNTTNIFMTFGLEARLFWFLLVYLHASTSEFSI